MELSSTKESDMPKENDMTNENFVLNGDFKDGLVSWENPSDQVKPVTLDNEQTAALFGAKKIVLRQHVAGEEVNRYLEPGFYDCTFRATRYYTPEGDTLNGFARIDAIFVEAGNPYFGIGSTVVLAPDETGWKTRWFEIHVTHEVHELTLELSSDSRNPNDETSDRVGIAITDVKLSKRS
jgi:hypothetical protein